ncbi:hypothetical protein SAMN02910265_01187 [Ruminococcus flavefaciens]|uniref:DUF4374 domain-containing protein n=1 Tax=Ruminococcus flavefaciens TaxID=1265 RepID=A0A1H6IRE3_RUMFL|nr:hypothetical protein [Ruminococcus flavefaciens]SEH51783.1 hypothetical protein SAMN02910265_01187 [Ruminococcus flavefaciens]
MNKMISMIAAAALAVSCFSCSDDKKKKEEPKPTDTAVNEDTGDTLVTEPVYREYSEDDFKTIDVSLSYPDREPPVNVSSVDLSGLDFGSKVPICNKAENVESYYTNDYYVPVDTGQDWSSYKDKAEKGFAANCYMYGGKYYIVAVYRAAFVGNYDFSLFQYDESSGKNEEIYSWSSNDINERYMQTPVLANGKMLYSVYNETDKISKVYAYDLDSGDVKIIYENSSPDKFIYVSRDNMGFPSMIVYDTDFYVIETLFYEEDSESFISDKTDDLGGRVVSQNIINGAPFYLVRPEDSQMLDMVSDHYRVSLSYIGGDIVYGDDKMFIVKNYTLIHIYDMEKMEHYILDVEDMGDEAVYSKGFVFLSSTFRDYDSPVYCIKPDMGIVYPIVDVFECNGIESFDDKVMFNTLKNQTNDADTETGGISYSVEKVYTVTVK